MPKYVLTYHGGAGLPETEAAQAELMAAWGDWFAELGDALVDGGAPFGETVAVGPEGESTLDPADPLTGYSILVAEDVQTAMRHASTCPVLAGGGTVKVSAAIEM